MTQGTPDHDDKDPTPAHHQPDIAIPAIPDEAIAIETPEEPNDADGQPV